MKVSGSASWVSYTTEENDGWKSVETGTRYGRRKEKFRRERQRAKLRNKNSY